VLLGAAGLLLGAAGLLLGAAGLLPPGELAAGGAVPLLQAVTSASNNMAATKITITFFIGSPLFLFNI